MKRIEQIHLEYPTENLYESSFLIAKGFKILGFMKQGKKIAIRFLKTPELDRASLDYFNGGSVSAISFSDAYRRLKDAVFQHKNEPQ